MEEIQTQHKSNQDYIKSKVKNWQLLQTFPKNITLKVLKLINFNLYYILNF